MYKFLFFILIILFSCNITLAENVILPYTDTSNKSEITNGYNTNTYDVVTESNNEIYSVFYSYQFGDFKVTNGEYICNTTFLTSMGNITVSENFIITSGIFSKNVNYTLSTYLNGNQESIQYESYNVFKTSAFFTNTKYSFINEKLFIKNKRVTTKGIIYQDSILTLTEKISLSNVNLTCNFDSSGYRKIIIEYIQIGQIPKSYYVEQLHPMLELPYKIIQGYDDGNLILNFLLISSYIVKVLIFWIKVLYQSLFTLFILTLIGIIPFISYTQSKTPQEFINRLGVNYTSFIYLIINSVKYIINLIIKIVELIPFI